MKHTLLAFAVSVMILGSSQPAEGQWEYSTLVHDGLVREFWVLTPLNMQPNLPLVLSLHGWTETFEAYRDYTLQDQHAYTTGYVLVLPVGIDRAWNSGQVPPRGADVDDVGFVADLIDTLQGRYGIDRSRVYCCGWSNGGRMTYRLACEIGHHFAAVASVGAGLCDLATQAGWHPLRPMPVLDIRGTNDSYAGDPALDLWSVEQTLDFWITRNDCMAPPDTVWIPDTDPADSCTVQRITWRDCADQTEVVHCRVLNGGHSWPGSAYTFSSEGNKNRDINANEEIWNFFRRFENPLTDVAFGERVGVRTTYLSPQEDSLYVTGRIRNPAGHPVRVCAILEGLVPSRVDSIVLSDDGLHGDGAPGDNVWGAIRGGEDFEEDIYTATLITYDDSLNTRHRCYRTTVFTTAGPVVVEGYTVVSADTAAMPGKLLTYRISVMNQGTTATVSGVTARVQCLDSRVIAQTISIPFGDLAPGQALTGSVDLKVAYTASCPVDTPMVFAVKISSEGRQLWEDSFADYVTDAGETADRVPTEFALEQNYPNPFNPTTVIDYQVPVSIDVRLAVYDLLGREAAVLVNEKKAPGFYRVDFDAAGLASGMYVYRLMAGGTVQIRKMIILR